MSAIAAQEGRVGSGPFTYCAAVVLLVRQRRAPSLRESKALTLPRILSATVVESGLSEAIDREAKQLPEEQVIARFRNQVIRRWLESVR